MLPFAVDYENVYRPAIQAWINGANPYTVFGFYNPTWVLALLAPLGLLPVELGRFLFFAISLGLLLFVTWRLKAHPVGQIAVVLSPLAFDSLVWGNIESIVLLGLVLPLPVGLILLALKPQMTWGAMAWLIYRAWKKKELFRSILPLGVITLGSWWLYGFYPMIWQRYSSEAGLNFSFFPYLLPLGLVLLWRAFQTHRLGYALAASPMFFQTLTPTVWLVEFVAIISLTSEVCLATLATWGVMIFSKVKL